MCGINGFDWNDENLIRRMNKRIKHRGPDGEGIYLDKKISLGHVRLSIIDLSEMGSQPMGDREGDLIIVFNGEIYNYIALRKILEKKGYVFKSRTDTEVILYAYREWGEGCVKKFNGMWAFAIYDRRKKTIFLSRDRLGIKPLFYFYNGNKFIFSSEIKAILAHQIERIPNESMIFDFMVYDLIDHTEETFFSGIKRLMPGHNIIYDIPNKKLSINVYYELSKATKKEKKFSFREEFTRSVKFRLISDVPVGSCLSGGLDSSAIVCTMKELQRNKDIHTFSLVFPGKKVDESKYQDIVVKETGVEWHKTTFGEKEIIKDIEDLIYTQEEPFRTLSIYGQYRVMKLAHDNKIKVVLDGQGSDEILAGYHWFFGYLFAELISKGKMLSFYREIKEYYKKYKNIKPLTYTLSLFIGGITQRSLGLRKSYINKNFIKKFRQRKSKDPLLRARSVNQISMLSVTYFSLPYLLRLEDKNSMRWGVESRVPFCDHQLVEDVCSLPSTKKIHNAWTKILMRESLKGVLPEEIRNRRDKVGFATPDDEILRSEEGKSLANFLIKSKEFKERPYWNYKIVEKMLDDHINNRKNNGRTLWKILITEMWFREWIDGGNRA